MLNTLVRYKEPGVQELTDSSFEHLTQAASGATTGHWLVMFFTSSCQVYTRLWPAGTGAGAVWPGLTRRLTGRRLAGGLSWGWRTNQILFCK